MAQSKDKKQSSDQPAKSKKSKEMKKAPKQHKVAKYFKDLKSEFKKVVWPSKKTVLNNTWIVLVTMVLSGVFVWALDVGLSQLVKLLVGSK